LSQHLNLFEACSLRWLAARLSQQHELLKFHQQTVQAARVL